MRILSALLALVALVFVFLNTPAGFGLLESVAAEAGVGLTGLGGRFPDRLTAAQLTFGDATGKWLEVDDLTLDWSPLALLRGALEADTLTARAVTITRFPQSGGDSSSGFSLPDVSVAHLGVDTLTLPDDVLSVHGAVALGETIDAHLAVESADLRGQGKVSLTASLTGPRAAAALAARLDGLGTGVLATGTLNLETLAARLHLVTDRVTQAGASAERIEIDLDGTPAAAHAHAVLTGLRLPGDRPDLLGAAPVTLDATYGPGVSLELTSATARLSVHGPIPGTTIAADWQLSLPDLAAFVPDQPGSLDLSGKVSGTVDHLVVQSTLDARLATGPVTGDITLRGLPASPVASVNLRGAWNGQAATLEAGAARDRAGVFHVTVVQAGFAGVQAQAAFAYDPAKTWPVGTATLTAPKLPAPATAGTASATVDLAADGSATVTAESAGLALPGVSIGRAALTAAVSDLAGTPAVKGTFTATDLRAGGVTQSVRLDADGGIAALALRLSATGTAAAQAAAVLDARASQLSLTSAQVTANAQTLRLTAPMRVNYADGVTVDRLRLALGAATLEIAGRLAPALDLTATLRNLPAALARLADPTLDAEGTLQADATLRGAADRPTGTIRVSGANLRLKAADYVPPAGFTATASLDGATARVNAKVTAGTTALTVTGTAPLAAGGAYDLRAIGSANLALLDPFLAPSGRQARGIVTLDGTLTGTQPRPGGTLTLRGGSFRDAIQGTAITDIAATVHADPGQIVLDSLTAHGPGPITAHGTLALDGDKALSASLTARDITPLASDALTARLSADLNLSGALGTGLAAAGRVRVARADIRIPETLPTNLPNLILRTAGSPPPPPSPELPVALDITVSAPSDIHVRGRGIDAELAGDLHLGGSVAAPKPTGGFTLTRGQVGLAGQTLNFTSGRVSFDGHLPIDPTLDFIARAQGSTLIATLAITGTASHPLITLSSTPELPQDEVLAQLLFRTSASKLSPFQIAQIAGGLAQLADVGGSASFDPLGRVRQGLGLDVLTVGGTAGGRQTVEAGRNIMRGVYVGAKQSASGTGTQATVRIDLARGLRLEADLGQPPPASATTTAGAPPSGNQINLTYEFEY